MPTIHPETVDASCISPHSDTLAPTQQPYIVPQLTRLVLDNIQGGLLTPILEADGGLLTS